MLILDEKDQTIELRKLPFSWISVALFFILPILFTVVFDKELGMLVCITYAFVMLLKSIVDGVNKYAFIQIDLLNQTLTIKKRILGLLIYEKIIEGIQKEDLYFPQYKISGKGIRFHLEYRTEKETIDLWRFNKPAEKEKVLHFLDDH